MQHCCIVYAELLHISYSPCLKAGSAVELLKGLEKYLFLIFLASSLTFSPSSPLRVGDVVQMICFVVPPTAQQFNFSAALISFNGSTPANLNQINNNDVTGVNTSRYTADVSAVTISTNLTGIRLTIFPYQASDGATNFSCHGVYQSGVPSESLISGYPQALAGLLYCVNRFSSFVQSF